MQYGRYELIEKLGEGGMATVHLALDPVLARHVAVKVIRTGPDPEGVLARRFAVEARACAALHHSNIIAIHDFGSQDGEQYLVMECISGPSLHRLVQAHPPGLSELATAALMLQAAEGLAEAHARGIIHRDIKPENMLLSPEGVLKIADFGIARSLEDTGLTQTGELVGSPKFMSPEQVEGEAVTPAADLFSLGGVICYCLTGRPPFEGGSTPSLMYQISHGELPVLESRRKELDPFWDALLGRLLDRRPDHRHFTAQTLAEEMRSFLGRKIQANPRQMVRELITASGLESKRALPSRTATQSTAPLTRSKKVVGSPLSRSALAAVVVVFLVAGATWAVAWFLWTRLPTSVARPMEGAQESGLTVVAEAEDSGPAELRKEEAFSEPVSGETESTDSRFNAPDILDGMREGWLVRDHEVLAALGRSIRRPERLLALSGEIRVQSSQHSEAARLLFHADYYTIVALQSLGRHDEARQACDAYLERHGGSVHDSAVVGIRNALAGGR